MKKIRILLLSLLALLFFDNPAFAAAFQIYETGTPLVGTAEVGQAVTSDASITYYNPAGMVMLPGSQYLLGSQAVIQGTNFSKNDVTTISGDNGGNAGSLIPGLDLYYAYQYSQRLRFGVSVNAPYGGALYYSDGWVGRYMVQNMLLYTMDLNPSIAYAVNDWIAIGGGITIEYANLYQTVALPIPGSPDADGQLNVKVSDFAPGVNVGVLLTPRPATKVGIAYRSRIIHHLSGSTTFLRVTDKPDTTTTLVMPQNIIVSAAQDVSDRFTLLGEAGWAAWSSMNNSVLHVSNYSIVTPQDWHDTYRLGIGAQYKAMERVLLQAGGSFDSSPTSSSHRTANLPMDRQYRLGLGLIYTTFQAAKLGFSYEYLNLGTANIDNVSAVGHLRGSYSKNYANVVQASINVDC